MTIEELKSKIEFSLLAGETNASGLIVGTFTIACDCHVSHECFSRPELLEGIKESMRTSILKRLYEDRSRELWEALYEFASWHCPIPEPGDPWTGPSFSKASAARARIIELGMYQPPHFHSTSGGKNE